MSPPRAPPSALAAPGPWRPSPIIRGSVALHVGAAALAMARPLLWPWALGALLTNHALLAGAGLWPRSRLLGPNWTRLPALDAAQRFVAITIDDGPDPEVTPRVLELLARRAAVATFFCIGRSVERHPLIVREICAGGHEIGNHSYAHAVHFALLGPRALALEIARAQEAIAAASGGTPRFFRAPAGLRNPFLDPLLARAGLQLASWTRRGFDTVSADGARIFARLTRGLAAGDILLLHDGHAARTRDGTAVLLEVLPRLLDAIGAAGLTPVTLRRALDAAGSAAAALRSGVRA